MLSEGSGESVHRHYEQRCVSGVLRDKRHLWMHRDGDGNCRHFLFCHDFHPVAASRHAIPIHVMRHTFRLNPIKHHLLLRGLA